LQINHRDTETQRINRSAGRIRKMKTSYLEHVTASPVEITFVMVLGHDRADREMEKGSFLTRCVQAGEVHELVAVNAGSLDNGKYHGASYLGFVAFNGPAVIYVGENLFVGGNRIGVLGGFDYTHFPNHMNILIETEQPTNGQKLGIRIGQSGEFAGSER
jgi:hypothetical protein